MAQTCRQIRAQLLPHRSLLVSQTLRCINETTSLNIKLANGLRGMREEWNNTTYGPNGVRVNRITSGRVGACARDMVEGCKCCGVVVCRVCTPLLGEIARIPRILEYSTAERHGELTGQRLLDENRTAQSNPLPYPRSKTDTDVCVEHASSRH